MDEERSTDDAASVQDGKGCKVEGGLSPLGENQESANGGEELKNGIKDPNDGLDDIFSSFMSEIDSLPKKARNVAKLGKDEKSTKNILAPLGTSTEECERLTLQFFASSYEVLRLGPEASEDEIKKQFRKISLLVHPDKCKHEKAQEAFNVVNTAYEQLQSPEFKEKYQKVLNHAKSVVLKQRKKQNAARKQSNEPPLPETDESMKAEVAAKCEELLKQHEEQRLYADKTRKANEHREKKQEEESKEEEKRKQEAKKIWAATQDTRVGGWRGFQSAIKTKDVRLEAFQPLKHKKEQRAAHHGEPETAGAAATAAKKRKTGIDESYKEGWR